jgi:mannose-P-dolichol utilization defect protein 1
MQFGGSAARVFTTLAEVDDKVILAGFLLGFALNAILFLQIGYYSVLGFGKKPTKVSSASTGESGTPKRKTKKAE